MHGFYGRIAVVDLSTQTCRVESVPDEVLSDSLGGKGLGTRLLIERNPPGVDPFAEQNHLIFATGPFCQSRIWGASPLRHHLETHIGRVHTAVAVSQVCAERDECIAIDKMDVRIPPAARLQVAVHDDIASLVVLKHMLSR